MNGRVNQGQALAWLVRLAAAVLLVGCHSGRTAEPATPGGGRTAPTSVERGLEEVSPARVEGTQVTYVETPDGAALVFTLRPQGSLRGGRAASEGEAEIRRRAHEMASLYARRERDVRTPTVKCTIFCCPTCSIVRVEHVPGGARLNFTPDAEPLRKAVADLAAQMAR
ncbi:uncharacterized protein SOCE26_060800 [Sorangium cellulosum]|uniref:Secreted protein n=1 Tax=Sorangium cellulosum TaxID=56 RepID=A0A2L0EZ79_SORCE|nr:hypothetical protein [Sorangium cellulosum]AUX44614.1 uncharacterized protein SOCE26_060800 [Sorangium cellulosum]